MKNLQTDFKIGEQVRIGNEIDTIIDFVTPYDKENWEMGYRVVLENNGTQTFGCFSKIHNTKP